MTKSVCVLMPCRNVANTLEESANSILSQRGVDVHLIAIDDGSSDNTPHILRSLSAKHRGVELVSTPGLGIVGALQTGSKCLSSPWVARMDADDIADPERLQCQIELLTSDVSLGAVGTQARAFPDDAVGEGLRLYLAWQNSLVTTEDHAREIFVESPFCHPSVTMRRAAYEHVGGYRDVSWAEDYDLWLRLWAAGFGLAKVPRTMLQWRRHAGQLTFRDPRYSKEEFRKARAAFLAPLLIEKARPVVIWGAGPTGKRLARELAWLGVKPDFFVDIDAAKIGRTRQGVAVLDSVAIKPGVHFTVVSVGARGARTLIREHLHANGFQEGSDFLVAS